MTCLSIFASVSVGFCNGDPVVRHSSLIGSSNPIPRPITDIRILREELYIRPSQYSQIVVKYLLWNDSDKDYTDIDYGFPVDYLGGGKTYENSAPIQDIFTESKYSAGWHDDYIRQIAFSFNGQPLAFKPSTEAVHKEPPLPDRADYPANEEGQMYYDTEVESRPLNTVYRRWFYTQFSIKQGETAVLEVSYALRNRSESSLYTNEMPRICSNELVYELSPACHWGNGIARELSVRIDASAILPDRGMKIEGLPSSAVKQDGAHYSYLAKDFAFRKAEPIRLCYDVLDPANAPELLSRRIPADKYEIAVEKALTAYPASNLSDLNFSTAWVATGGDKYGKISIRFYEPAQITGFALVNGYHKSESAYLNNNRLLTVEVTVNGRSDGEITFEKAAVFKNGKTYYDNNEYEPLYFGNMIGHPDVYFYQLSSHDDRVKEIELTITGIHPGAKYNDTCVSEIIFFADERPEGPGKP